MNETLAVAQPWGTVLVSGPDALSWLNAVITCETTGVDDERGAWGLLLTKQGKVTAELVVAKSDAGILLGCMPPTAPELAEELDRYLVMEDAEVEAAAMVRWCGIYGRRAREVGRLLRDMEAVVAASVIDWSRPEGVAIAVRDGRFQEVVDRLVAEGIECVDRGDPAGEQRWREVRVELGLPEYGVDYDRADNPHAASLERRTVNWSKGCYLGQEVVCMQDMRGKVKRRLVRVRSEAQLTEGASVTFDGKDVGRLTTVSGTVGIAKVDAPAYEAGTTVTVGDYAAEVAALLPNS